MAYKDLQSFMETLDSMGQLKFIDASVSSDLEITEITNRVSKANGPALLFRNVKGSNYYPYWLMRWAVMIEWALV